MKAFRYLTLLFAAAAVAGCGGNGESNGATVSGSAASRAASVKIGGESGTELAERQVLHLGNGAELQSLDPHRSEDVSSSNVQRDLFEGLVSEAPNGDLIPGAAESWTRSDDGKLYTFTLRRNARWSNGDPVTAQDFVFGLRRAIDPATLSVYTHILSPILNADDIAMGKKQPAELGVRAIDDYTLEIELANATPYFLGLLTHSMTYPVHRASLERHGDQWTRPGNLVGNGAFMLAEWVVQSHIKIVRNPNYWDSAKTILEEVWFHAIEDQSAEFARYRANELDETNSIPTAQIDLIRDNYGSELRLDPYLGVYYYGFNVTRPPFKDSPELRRALSLAINRNVITEQILQGGQIPAYGFVPPVAGYTGQKMREADWTQAEREAEAKRLYAAAGYSAANPLRTEIMYNTSEDHKRIALAIASMWKTVLGVEATLLNQEWKVFIDTRNRKLETQVYRQGWIGDYNDAFSFLELLRSTSGQNDTGYSSAEYDRFVTAAQSELDMERRAELLQNGERQLLEDMPVLPIYFYVRMRLMKPWVGGFEPNIMDHHHHKNFFVLKH
jgi:oligopeptide transport system substrate-binding protein